MKKLINHNSLIKTLPKNLLIKNLIKNFCEIKLFNTDTNTNTTNLTIPELDLTKIKK